MTSIGPARDRSASCCLGTHVASLAARGRQEKREEVSDDPGLHDRAGPDVPGEPDPAADPGDDEERIVDAPYDERYDGPECPQPPDVARRRLQNNYGQIAEHACDQPDREK